MEEDDTFEVDMLNLGNNCINTKMNTFKELPGHNKIKIQNDFIRAKTIFKKKGGKIHLGHTKRIKLISSRRKECK